MFDLSRLPVLVGVIGIAGTTIILAVLLGIILAEIIEMFD